MFGVVQRCAGTSMVMFRCTGNVRECAGTRREVSEVRLGARECSGDAQMCAGRFRDAPEVRGYARRCAEICGDVWGMW